MTTSTPRLGPADLRRFCDEAFNWFEQQLGETAESRFERLRVLAEFRKHGVGWAASGRDRLTHCFDFANGPGATDVIVDVAGFYGEVVIAPPV